MKKLIISALILVLVGCAKDKNVDDWRAEKAAQLAAKNQEAIGIFQGPLTAEKDGSAFGGLSIQIQNDTIPQRNPDGTGSEVASGIKGTISFMDGNQKLSTFVFASASYTPENHYFRAAVNVPLVANQTGTINVYGTISGSSLNGQLDANGLTMLGGNFQLSRGGDMKSAALRAPKLDPKAANPIFKRSYTGTVNYDDARTPQVIPVDIALRQGSTKEQFYNHFSQDRAATVIFHLHKGVDLPCVATVDDVSGNIIGTYDSSVDSIPVHGDLNCWSLQDGSKGWYCEYTSNGFGFNGDFKPAQQPEIKKP